MYKLGQKQKPLFCTASLYTSIAFWNIFLLEERFDILLAILLGNSFRIVGGWFECLCMYTVKLSGFL